MAKKKSSLAVINGYAKKIRKDGESWIEAIRRATRELKKLGKI